VRPYVVTAHLLALCIDVLAVGQVAVQQAARVGGQELHGEMHALCAHAF